MFSISARLQGPLCTCPAQNHPFNSLCPGYIPLKAFRFFLFGVYCGLLTARLYAIFTRLQAVHVCCFATFLFFLFVLLHILINLTDTCKGSISTVIAFHVCRMEWQIKSKCSSKPPHELHRYQKRNNAAALHTGKAHLRPPAWRHFSSSPCELTFPGSKCITFLPKT